MLRKAILAIGAIALIWSLMNPITVTYSKQVGVEKGRAIVSKGGGYFTVTNSDQTITSYEPDKPVYAKVTERDLYKTGMRSFSIVLGTAVLWFIAPQEAKKEEVSI